jgi:GNAT superfamily N-acetyltransferase
MGLVLHLRKELIAPPVAVSVAGTQLRTLEMPDDVSRWLALRDRAMADQLPSARLWTEADFHVEMVNKPWWRVDRTWLAVHANEPFGNFVGAVTLAMREGKLASVPVVHWLLVDPIWRRRGIGRMLLSRLEQAAWDGGWREVQLETHAGWAAAVAFYQSMGYAPLRERSPR